VRWWLQTNVRQFSIDNALATDMDFSMLPRDLWMIHWIEGRGEIEYQTPDKRNLNGLREKFTDVEPYVPLFKQFLRKMQAQDLLPEQARGIQSDLVRQLYESKRQAPFHRRVAGVDLWDARDEALFPSHATALLHLYIALEHMIEHRKLPTQLPMPWLVPHKHVEPVLLKLTEATDIMRGIADRTGTLTIVKRTKLAEIAGLVDLDSVIEYDVTTGWD
jgi:hypothetical protein